MHVSTSFPELYTCKLVQGKSPGNMRGIEWSLRPLRVRGRRRLTFQTICEDAGSVFIFASTSTSSYQIFLASSEDFRKIQMASSEHFEYLVHFKLGPNLGRFNQSLHLPANCALLDAKLCHVASPESACEHARSCKNFASTSKRAPV